MKQKPTENGLKQTKYKKSVACIAGYDANGKPFTYRQVKDQVDNAHNRFFAKRGIVPERAM